MLRDKSVGEQYHTKAVTFNRNKKSKEGRAEVGCKLGLSHTFHQVQFALPALPVGIGALLNTKVELGSWCWEGAVSAHHLLANCRSRRAATVWPHGGANINYLKQQICVSNTFTKTPELSIL